MVCYVCNGNNFRSQNGAMISRTAVAQMEVRPWAPRQREANFQKRSLTFEFRRPDDANHSKMGKTDMAIYEEIELIAGSSSAKIAPARGCIITDWRAQGLEMLFLNRDTFESETSSVRGGIPILFPFAGRLKDDLLVPAGTTMKQHGFARSMEWEVIGQTSSSLRARLEDTPETRVVFPWPFRLEHEAILSEHALHLELLVENRGESPMPVSPGWHPYYHLRPETKESVRGTLPLTEPGFFHNEEPDLPIPASADGRAEFDLGGRAKIRVCSSPLMKTLQFWSLPNAPFICIEPFTGPANTINTPHTPMIEPGEVFVFWTRMELLEKGL